MKNDKLAFSKYTFSLLLFGINGIVASKISLSSYEIVFLRTFIGSIFLLLMFLVSGGKLHIKDNKTDTLFIALSGIAMGTSWIFLYEGFKEVGVSIATLLYYSGPIIVMFLSPLIFKERLTAPKVIGFFVAVCGMFFINGRIAGESISNWGLFCGIMSGITYFFMVTFNKCSKNILGLENAVIQLIVSFITVGMFIGLKQHFVIDIAKNEWHWIILLGTINTGLGCFLYFSSLSKLSAQTVAIFGYLELLSAVIFSAVFLGERMTPTQIIGALLILSGTLIGEFIKSTRLQKS